MAYICKKLRLSEVSGICNTCLPLHVTIGLLEENILSINDVVNKYRKFFHCFFSTNFMRDGVPTFLSFIRNLNLADKVCIRVVNAIEVDNFVLLERYYGRLSCKKIFIAHSKIHFFLVKALDF